MATTQLRLLPNPRTLRNVWIIALLLLSVGTLLLISASSTTPPWQQSGDVRQESLYRSLPRTVFAPGGRLYSVEASLRAVSDPDVDCSNLVVALPYQEGVVVVTTNPASPYLYHKNNNDTYPSLMLSSSSSNNNTGSSLSFLFGQLDHNLWGIAAGSLVDGQVLLRHRMFVTAHQLRQQQQQQQRVTAAPMARSLADAAQSQTQRASSDGRLLECSAVLVCCSDHHHAGYSTSNSSIWRVDPSGQFWKCHAVVVGRGATPRVEQDLLERLLRRVSNDNNNNNNNTTALPQQQQQRLAPTLFSRLDLDEALGMAAGTIQHALAAMQAKQDKSTSMVGPVELQALILTPNTPAQFKTLRIGTDAS